MELFLLKKIEIQKKRLVATGATGPKDPILSEYWQVIRRNGKTQDDPALDRKIRRQQPAPQPLSGTADSKERPGPGEQKGSPGFPRQLLPHNRPRPETEERLRLRRAVLEEKPVDDRTFMLLSLDPGVRLDQGSFSGTREKEARKKIKAMVKNEIFGNTVTEEITAVVAACVIASTAASVAAST